MKKRKIVALISVLILCLALFTACSSSEEESANVNSDEKVATNDLNEDNDASKDLADENKESDKVNKDNDQKEASAENKQESDKSTSIENATTKNLEEKNNSSNVSTATVTEHPKPVDPEEIEINENKTYTCTMSITCNTILNNLDNFDQNKLSILPDDGVIYPTQKVTFNEGETVFDVLLKECQKNKIHMEFISHPVYDSGYIEGIGNIYEFDCGELSGWMYTVNDWTSNYGAGKYVLKDGDVIQWRYTCDLGADLGIEWMG